ncbi:flagellar hook-basal body complex protein [Alphaproteobacteria bacterium]|nr:flagellar hook-basal body complex protein [Alphaproteobacteria bacterium]
MDKLIYTAYNTLNNIYDNRSLRAQNMANVNVPGYRRDLGSKPVGAAFLQVEGGFQTRALSIRDDTNVFESDPGTLSQTGSDMDLAIRGDGYFLVKGVGEPSLTRRGDLNVNEDGNLINGSNHVFLDKNLEPIQIGAFRKLMIAENGDIFVEPLGSPVGTQELVATIGLTSGAGVKLKKFPDGEIRVEDGSLPAADQLPTVIQKHLELSNVNITEELINTIEDQRAYEVNIKLITSASEVDEAGASLMRLPG